MKSYQKAFKKIACVSMIAGGSILGNSTAQATESNDTTSNTIREYTLDNGLRILVKPDRRAPVVLAQIWYKVGSVYEPDGITGISHMLEHMMFKGTKEFQPGDIDTLVETNGGSQNAFTYYDFTAYYQFWSKDKLPLSFEIESSRMSNLVLDKTLFEKEREVVMEERRMRTEDNPIAFAQERFLATAYTANPRHHPVIGWMDDIQQYTIADLQTWYNQWYAPNNAIIVVIGDIQPEEVYQQVEKNFGHIKKSNLPTLKKHTEIPAAGEKNITVHHPNVTVPTLLMGFNTPSINSESKKDVYPLIVLEMILGGDETSRLQEKLVRDTQIATTIHTDYEGFALDGVLFSVLALPSKGQSLKDIQAVILAEIKNIADNGITKKELERVKTNVLADKIYTMDSLPSQALAIGSFASIGLPADYTQTLLDNILKVTADQVKAVAQKYLQTSNLTVAMLEAEPKSHPGSDSEQAITADPTLKGAEK